MKNMGGNVPAMDSGQMQEQMMLCSRTWTKDSLSV